MFTAKLLKEKNSRSDKTNSSEKLFASCDFSCYQQRDKSEIKQCNIVKIISKASHPAATCMHLNKWTYKDDLQKFKVSIRMREKEDLSYTEPVTVAGARRAGLTILQTADPLGLAQCHNRVWIL